MTGMTEEAICSCIKHKELRDSPESIEQLHLHQKGFREIRHLRKLVINRCKELTKFDGNPISKAERRRCTFCGFAVRGGGSFDEADEADRQEATILKSEHEAGSVCSNKSIGSSVIESIKKVFGFIGTSRRSSNISWTSSLDYSLGGSAISERLSMIKGLSVKKELEQVLTIVESQRTEILDLKYQLVRKQVKEKEPICDGSGMEDSERDTSYSFVKNGQFTSPEVVPDQQREASTTGPIKLERRVQQKRNNTHRDFSNNSPVLDFDPFSVFPPIPPPSNRSISIQR